MAAAEIRSQIAARPMSLFQYVIVVICILMNVTDGYDSASMSNAAPLIRNEWSVTPAMLGVAFSSQAIGLVIGAIALAPLADRFGRRTIIFTTMGLIAGAMLLSAGANSVETLAFLRFVTGIGLGAMLASLNVMMAEYSNARLGNILMALLHGGFAAGTTLSGILAVPIVETLGWRGIFLSGGMVNAALCLVALLMMPESLDFLVARQPKNALARINGILGRMRHPPLASLPPPAPPEKRPLQVMAVLTPTLRWPTLLLWATAFAYYVVSYFQFQWTPAILAEAGLPEHAALSSHAVTGIGALIGNLLMGAFAAQVGAARLTGIFLAISAVTLATLGVMPPNPEGMLLVAGLASLFIQGAFTGIIITTVRFYAPEIRMTGTGYTLGIGRIGAVFGPLIGGALMSLGWERGAFYPVFAILAIFGALTIWSLMGAARRSGVDLSSAAPTTQQGH